MAEKRSHGTEPDASDCLCGDMPIRRDLDAERAVLGTLLVLPELHALVPLGQYDFDLSAHREIYCAMEVLRFCGELIDEEIGAVSLRAMRRQLRTQCRYRASGGLQYLGELCDLAVTEFAFVEAAQLLAGARADRALLRYARQLLFSARNPESDLSKIIAP